MSQFIEMFGDQNTNDKGWTESLVKDEFKLSMGKTPARNNPECWDNGTHKWVSISDMSSYTRYTGDTSEYITDYAIADSGIKAVPKGTIIMSFKLSIGRTAITSEDLYTNEAIMAFAGFDEKKFNIDFLHFLIANKNWLLGAKQAVKGQTLNKESIGNAKIVIPPIKAQEEFASIYNQADKSEFVGCKSQFIDMFNKVAETKSLCEICRPKQWPTIPTKDFTEDGYLVYGANGIIGHYSEYNHESPTILMACRGASCGAINISKPYSYITGNAMCMDEIIPEVSFEYLSYFLYNYNYKTIITGGAQPQITYTNLKKVMVPIPPYEEQLKFALIYKQADKSEYYN